MTLLSYNQLHELRKQGVINCDPANINGSSIDITLSHLILVESPGYPEDRPLRAPSISDKESILTCPISLECKHYFLEPGEFILASSKEIFNLPSNISAEYKLKSSMARCGLEHLNAGWCDAGWTDSTLTLELKNMTRFHTLKLKNNMKIGQMVFFFHEPVPDKANYAYTGRYNKQTEATASKGVE